MNLKRVTTGIMLVVLCTSGCSSINQRSELVSREFLSEVSSYEAIKLNKDGSDSDTGYKNLTRKSMTLH